MARPDLQSAADTAPDRALVLGALFTVLALVLGAAAPAWAAPLCTSGDPRVLAESTVGRIAFGDRARMVALTPTCGPLGMAVRRARAGSRFLLVVEDLRATHQPGAIFDITLAPSHASTNGRMRMLGTLNFFNAHPATAGRGRSVSYDVTAQLKALARHDSLYRGIALAIAPMSAPEPATDASAGAIKLVVQPN